MKGICKGIFLLPFLVLCVSCKQKTFDTESELWHYITDSDNGYNFEKKIGNTSYTLTYRPTDVLVKQELGNSYTGKEVDSLREKYGSYLYFNLNMSINNQEVLNSKVTDRNAFGGMINQLIFGMEDKVHLIGQKRDTIPMADYIYPRMYGMSNSTNMLFVFPKDDKLLSGEHFLFTVEDLGFSTGEIGFKIYTESLKNEPRLNFKNIPNDETSSISI